MVANQEPIKKQNRDELVYTPRDNSINAIALFASQICNTPFAFISIINQSNEWFKSSIGLTEKEEQIIKDLTFFKLSENQKIYEIEDIINNNQLLNHPLMLDRNIVFFASIPLVTPSGSIIGSIGLMDKKKRKLTPRQKKP